LGATSLPISQERGWGTRDDPQKYKTIRISIHTSFNSITFFGRYWSLRKMTTGNSMVSLFTSSPNAFWKAWVIFTKMTWNAPSHTKLHVRYPKTSKQAYRLKQWSSSFFSPLTIFFKKISDGPLCCGASHKQMVETVLHIVNSRAFLSRNYGAFCGSCKNSRKTAGGPPGPSVIQNPPGPVILNHWFKAVIP